MRARIRLGARPGVARQVRAAAVRLTGGCSASFVSNAGLILTNHHCVAELRCRTIRPARTTLLDNGFIAADRDRERKCPGQQAEVVTAIIDVTADAEGARSAAPPARRWSRRATPRSPSSRRPAAPTPRPPAARSSACTAAASTSSTPIASISDVRLVWAPEVAGRALRRRSRQFQLPALLARCRFLRAYENGKPVAPRQHLEWNPRAPKDGEATFVVGNPGSTQRLLTHDQLAFEREVALPIIAARPVRTARAADRRDGRRAPSRTAKGIDELTGSRTASRSISAAPRRSNDPAFRAKLAAAEADLRAKVAGQCRDRRSVERRSTRRPPTYRDLYLAAIACSTPSSDLY